MTKNAKGGNRQRELIPRALKTTILGLLGMFCNWRRSEPFSAEILRSSATVKLVYSSFPQMRRILSLR